MKIGLGRFPQLVARVPASVQAKLMAVLLTLVALLIVVGAVGLHTLGVVNRRADELVGLHRKIAAYRQLQHDTTAQLYNVASALLVPERRTLEATLRKLNQFRYDLDRLEFVAAGEAEIFRQVREEYARFIGVVDRGVELIGAGRAAQGRELQLTQAGPLADRLERLTNQLVNRAEADLVAAVEQSREAYAAARRLVIAFAVGAILLALGLGYAFSGAIIGPVERMDRRFEELAGGDFSGRVEIPNRDEFGALAVNLNRMSEELGRLYRQIEEWNRTLEEKVRQQVDEIQRMARLKRYLSPQIAETVLKSDEIDLFKGHRREVTVVFLDLRGFTAFSDSAEPEEVMELLRTYHGAMGRLIFKYEGTLERFAGDGIMVFFNDPVPCEDHAERAVRMAAEMRERVQELRAAWLKKGYELDLGIGVSTGFATLGNIGFEGRMDYGALGNVTNLAARLCGEAKGGQILVNQKAFGIVQHLVDAEPLHELQLKGLLRPVLAFNITGLKRA